MDAARQRRRRRGVSRVSNERRTRSRPARSVRVRRFYSWSVPTPRLLSGGAVPCHAMPWPGFVSTSRERARSASESARVDPERCVRVARMRRGKRPPEMCVRVRRNRRERGRGQDADDDDDAVATATVAARRRAGGGGRRRDRAATTAIHRGWSSLDRPDRPADRRVVATTAESFRQRTTATDTRRRDRRRNDGLPLPVATRSQEVVGLESCRRHAGPRSVTDRHACTRVTSMSRLESVPAILSLFPSRRSRLSLENVGPLPGASGRNLFARDYRRLPDTER